MNDLLFFVISGTVIGLSFYLGFKNGNDKKIKEEIRQFLHEVTVSKMAHDLFMQRAKNETIFILKTIGAKGIDVKKIRTPKLPKPEEFDSSTK